MNTKTDDFIKYRKYIGYIIKTKRKKNRITQTQLAEELNINVSTVSRYEKADIEIPASYLEKISEICKIEPKEYFSHTKTPEKLLYEIAEILGYKVSDIDYKIKEYDINIELINELEHAKWLAIKSIKEPTIIKKKDFISLVDNIIIETNQKNSNNNLMAYWEQLKRINKYKCKFANHVNIYYNKYTVKVILFIICMYSLTD